MDNILLIVALILAILGGVAALVPEPFSRFAVLLVAAALVLVVITLL